MLTKINDSEHQQLGCQCVHKISKKVKSASGEEEYTHHSIINPIITKSPDLSSIDMSELITSMRYFNHPNI